MACVLIGTLDTKGGELAFVRDRLRAEGLETIVVDVGSRSGPAIAADIDRAAVFRRAGMTADPSTIGRGEAVALAAEGARLLAIELMAAGRVEGVFGLGGSAGTVIASAAMRALPFGVPKVLVSTLAGGSMGPFVGTADIAVFHPVADIAGLNRVTRRSLGSAAAALAGMVRAAREPDPGPARPVVAATMFGVTTPCVDAARARLEAEGLEVIVFHATGSGGRAMERLIADGRVDAVLDLTTTELADELVGGILSAGPDRLDAAGARGIPQVVSVGALDMVNFGPMDSVPPRFEGRRLHAHNPSVTLMRTTLAENVELGRRIAAKVAAARGPAAMLLPLGGVSAIDVDGGPFRDAAADAALFDAIRAGLADAPGVALVEHPGSINDPDFARLAAATLLGLLRALSTQMVR